MPDTTVSSALRVQQWAKKEFREYVRISPFKPLMGADQNAVIHVKEELTKDAGDSITFALVTRITTDAVTGDNQMEGNETVLGNYGHRVYVDQARNAVSVGRFEKIKTEIDLLEAAEAMLRKWNLEQLQDLFIARFIAPTVSQTFVSYAAASEAQKDAWVVANNPSASNVRILCGAALSNIAADHSTGLGNIDGTADDMHQDIVRLAKRLAQGCSPHITPVTTKGADAGKERFVHLMGSIPFRDLEANMDTVHQNADSRGEDNHIFRSGDIMVGNVICKEVPRMDTVQSSGGAMISGVGSGPINVASTVFCGAQTLGLAWAQRMHVDTEDFDYKNRKGVCVAEIRGCEKLIFNDVQNGAVQVYVSAVGD